MRFPPVKCNMMQLTRKRIKKIHASYTLEGTDLENDESIKYLGVVWFDFCFTALRHILGHFGRGQLT